MKRERGFRGGASLLESLLACLKPKLNCHIVKGHTTFGYPGRALVETRVSLVSQQQEVGSSQPDEEHKSALLLGALRVLSGDLSSFLVIPSSILVSLFPSFKPHPHLYLHLGSLGS